MKKLLLFAMILLLTSCSKPAKTVEPEIEEPISESIEEEDNVPEPVRYTGEIITDGFYGKTGRIYFIPDKETRELLKSEYPLPIDAGESIPLDYPDINIVKDLPLDPGVYKVEVEANFSSEGIISELQSIKLTEEIGTVEYEGKTYPTNELDEIFSFIGFSLVKIYLKDYVSFCVYTKLEAVSSERSEVSHLLSYEILHCRSG
ncbi:hypothetical protein HZF24_18080 [Sedimentibacter hydroxybenzoicus DSM 7310]|uniref:Lipoprotein n=1 Tax=Sedimentibacter hydroxybenzoicus DSM 7310 TaxID=1123245 RepID=A0A974GYB6_SEDHY|nr:hypothetical protein [Sedimentibacter hydroxybenzoicus]NYB76060.1 hypothetical protein [Sedimentibacter hydroxybenzoicus DSM 7310]